MKKFLLFRGDTFLKALRPNDYKFQVNDKIHIAVMVNEYSKDYLFEEVIEIKQEQETIDIEIPASKTSTFEVGTLLLEVEITYGDGIVKTQQYELEVREDGIYERN